MARRRRRRRRSTVTTVRRRRRRRVASNPPRRRRRRRFRRNAVTFLNPGRRRRHSRRRFRRNPSFSVRGILSRAKDAAVTGVQIVAGKAVTRVVRNLIPGGKPAAGQGLSWMQVLIELASATLVGYAGEMFLGTRAGTNLMAGGFAGVVESMVKMYKVPIVADALGDDGDPYCVTVPPHLAGYVREAIVNAPAEIAGYVQDGAFVNGPGLGEPPGASGLIEDDSGAFADVSF